MTVTERDRETARELRRAAVFHGNPDELERAIAAALAAERERARAPFLALAEELDRESADLEAYDMETAPQIADRIRAAAKEAEQ